MPDRHHDIPLEHLQIMAQWSPQDWAYASGDNYFFSDVWANESITGAGLQNINPAVVDWWLNDSGATDIVAATDIKGSALMGSLRDLAEGLSKNLYGDQAVLAQVDPDWSSDAAHMTAGFAYDQGYFEALGAWHGAIDFNAQTGLNEIYWPATLPGTWIGTGGTGDNRFVAIEDVDGYTWLFGHVDETSGSFSDADPLQQGEQLGVEVDYSPSSPHVNLEVLLDVDPSVASLAWWDGDNGATAADIERDVALFGLAGDRYVSPLQRFFELEMQAEVFDNMAPPGGNTGGANAAFDPFDGEQPQLLLDALLAENSGITIDTQTVTYVGADGQASFYNGSIPDLGIGPGILLTSGDGTPPLTNTEGGYSISHNGAGDPRLDLVAQAAFSGAGETNDANSLEFDFTVDEGLKGIRLDLVFGSDEYPEYSNSSFIDIASVFINGQNVALFNNQTDQPLSVIDKNLEIGNFRDNAGNILDIEYDGVSEDITIIAPVQAGVNTLTIAIADTGDHILDSALFLSNLTGSATGGAGLSKVVAAASDNGEELTGSTDNEVFDGGDGDDIIDPVGGNNVINAKGGNDKIKGGVGDNEIDGGEGFDQVIYEGFLSSDFPIKVLANGFIQIGSNTDFVINVEEAVFDDQTIDLTALSAPAGNTPAPTPGPSQPVIDEEGPVDDPVASPPRSTPPETPGFVVLRGGAGDDQLTGTEAADILIPAGGNNTLTGGANIDVALFAAADANTTIDRSNPDRVIVSDSAGSHQVANDVEILAFSNGLMTLTRPGSATMIDGALPLMESFYLAQNPDVAAAIESGLLPSAAMHFSQFGLNEGRNPNPLYSEQQYLQNNPDVAEAVINGLYTSGLQHYALYGQDEARLTSPWFDQAAYLDANPDVAAAALDPTAHFLEYGAQEGRPGFVYDVGLLGL
ncbi:choice-of-anchor L domain-containing protein [Halochromatium roseum]|uniref:choice-of-anchor L domain-containing protein n=1 Tax=Halochromatium roseum TaxID=391920 RepID=UPI0019113ABA|nr:choice-of-anchor L domain-containing protein [Halochromatium roseum]MBK5937907.1 hypothetical protein [Halochromatium roseum]